MKNRKYNIQSLFFCIIYATLAILIIYILFTKTYLSFLTPKSFKYLLFMVVILIVFSFIEFKTLKSPTRNIKLMSSLVILLPIALILLPDLQIDSTRLNSKYITPTLNASNSSSSKQKTYVGETMTFTIDEKEEDKIDLATANSSNSFSQDLHLDGLDEANKTITISDEQFYDWTTAIFANQSKYLGYKVIVNGMIFRDDSFMSNNQFVPSRLMMSCCIADAVPAGLIAEYEDSSKIEVEKWVKVTGNLVLGKYNEQSGPIIKVISIEEGQKPKEEFIYPK